MRNSASTNRTGADATESFWVKRGDALMTPVLMPGTQIYGPRLRVLLCGGVVGC